MKRHTVEVGTDLTFTDIQPLLTNANCEISITFSSDAFTRCMDSNAFVHTANDQQVFYGVNTGFGPMANTYIQPQEQTNLQYNLVRSHACGLGTPLDVALVRTIMLVRLHTLARGYSGVHLTILETLKAMIEHNITPIVPEHGSVGASGDLVQLAHIALGAIGEGDVVHNGERTTAAAAMKTAGITPVSLSGRDGLALINGTSAMTGIALHNVHAAKNLMAHTLQSSALLLEIASAHDECFSNDVAAVRPHCGQKFVVDTLQTHLADAPRIVRNTHLQPAASDTQTSALEQPPQEIYSLRCIPQILGPIQDTITQTEHTVITELNSVTDNPLIFADHITHNGNFHGDYVSLAMDTLRIASTKLSVLLDRQVNFIVNPNQNKILPPFANGGTPGLELGLQAAQFVATSTTAENQTLAAPIYTHSITTNNDNQDVVSMGTNSALLTRTVLHNTHQVLAVLLATQTQAVDVLHIKDALSPVGTNTYAAIRTHFPFLEEDVHFAPALEAVVTHLLTTTVYNNAP